MDNAGLAAIGLFFFAAEFLADLVVVKVLHEYFEVPMLSVSKFEPLLSLDNLALTLMQAAVATGMVSCIAMAAAVPI